MTPPLRQKKRILITGGTGFIGRALVAHLHQTGSPLRLLVRKASHHPSHEECVGNILDSSSLDRALVGVDTVMHLAGATLVRRISEYAKGNTKGTQNLLEACARLPEPPRVVFLSSLAARGPDGGTGPVDAYGKSKRAAEERCRVFRDRVPVTVIRAPAVIGKGEPTLFRVFRWARRGHVFVPGTVDYPISFVHLQDLVECLGVAPDRGQTLGADPEQGVYTVAMPKPTTVLELGLLIAELIDKKVTVSRLSKFRLRMVGRLVDLLNLFFPTPVLFNSDKVVQGLAGGWSCDSLAAERDLGFVSRHTLREGLVEALAFYREHGWYREDGWI